MAKHTYIQVTEAFAAQNEGKTKKDKTGHPVNTFKSVKDKQNRTLVSSNTAQEFGELFNGMTVLILQLDSETDFEKPNTEGI